jgi:carbamoyltransferase
LPSDNLIIAGGCALNATANGILLRSGLFKNVFIPTNCDDTGIPLGNCFYRYPEWQPTLKYNNQWTRVENIGAYEEVDLNYVYKALNQRRIIAWFEEGSEYGPRALGHRSLLAIPDTETIRLGINEIKGREYWRPLAPIVTDNYWYSLTDEKPQYLHELRLATVQLKPEIRDIYPAIYAVDGTARPQIIYPNQGLLYELMNDYNLPCLLNTSLNFKGEPIIETVLDYISSVNRHHIPLNFIDFILVQNGRLYKMPVFTNRDDYYEYTYYPFA